MSVSRGGTALSDSSSLDMVLAGITRGDGAAWREIVRRFGPLVLHTAVRIGLSSSDAADIAQLTWLLLWKYSGKIREPEHLATWLVVTARREAIRLAGASRRYVLSADPETEYSGNNRYATDIYPVEGDYDGAVATALARLPARYRALLLLVTSDLCPTYAEISTQLGLPIGSIGPMRMRALAMLQNTPEFRREVGGGE